MKKLALKVLGAIGVTLAFSSMAGACLVWTHQPKVPQKLLK